MSRRPWRPRLRSLRLAPGAVPQGLFGSTEKASSDLSQFPKWTGALAQYERERPLELLPCARKGCALQRWRQYLGGLRGKPPLQQLEAINRYVNQTPYQSDAARFGVADHWATPREFLGQSGDCEDYAIAKYLSLRHLGWDVSSLRLLVLNDEIRRDLHAVLIAYVDGTAYVLDNLAADVRPHAAIRHYRPIFSINETTWYLHGGWKPDGGALGKHARSSATRNRGSGATRPPTGPARDLRRPRRAVRICKSQLGAYEGGRRRAQPNEAMK